MDGVFCCAERRRRYQRLADPAAQAEIDMREIPSNFLLADEFAKIFDGFSNGSNDLTRLVLGVGRDSEIVAHIFDERDAVVPLPAEAPVRSFERGWTAR
jgi:pyruvate,water dikinase